MVDLRKKTEKPEKTCIEDPNYVETRKTVQVFDRRFKYYLLFSILYGLIFINYIDIIICGAANHAYHLWLGIMYFLPFVTLSIFFRRNWQLTLGLGIIASLMNDVFYGVASNIIGKPLDLTRYYNLWLIPSNATIFQLNLGFTITPVFSWMMAISIYARIIAVYFLIRTWKAQVKIRYLTVNDIRSVLETFL